MSERVALAENTLNYCNIFLSVCPRLVCIFILFIYILLIVLLVPAVPVSRPHSVP